MNEGIANDYEFSVHEIRRRGLLKWMVVGIAVVFASIGISMFRAFGMNPAKKLYDTVWSRGQRLMTRDMKTVSVDTLVPGSRDRLSGRSDRIGKGPDGVDSPPRCSR